MGAIERFLKRRGYAKLDRYGLVLTPDDRVVSKRPVALDDGLGERVVGWRDGDLAAMSLDQWSEPTKQAKKRQPAPALPKPPPKAPPARPSKPAPVVAAPVVAAEPVVEEDEWEWEIAVARARAVAEEVEEARVDLLGASAVIAAAVIPRKTSVGMAVVKPEGDPMASWPKTEQFDALADHGSGHESVPHVMSPIEKALLVGKRTIIPVPVLPTIDDPRAVRPVTNGPPPPRLPRVLTSSPPPRRYARGTAQPVRPVGEDKTSPYITLPDEVKPSGFAHTKRVAAKQR